MKTFNIKPYEDFDISFLLVVSNTRKQMLIDIEKHCVAFGEKNTSCSDTAAMFYPTRCITDDRVIGLFTSNVVGTMFLNLEDVDIAIIAHECAHAAFFYEHRTKRYTGDFSDDEQESFCYFIGDITQKVREVIKNNFAGSKLGSAALKKL